MNHNVNIVLIRHIKELFEILGKYSVSDKSSLISIAGTDLVFQKAVFMSVGYIGELSEKLDDGIKNFNTGINWRRLSASRNIIFYDYDIVDMEIISNVIFEDISSLKLLKEIDSIDLRQALDLVNNVFSEFVAVDYSEQGENTFKAYLENKYEEVSSDLISGHKKMWACYQKGEIIGVIAIRDISHIALMFVDKRYHKKGIARYMFNVILEEIKLNAEITQITVNSSPYAVKVYEQLGFVQSDKQQEKDGIVFTPMVCIF